MVHGCDGVVSQCPSFALCWLPPCTEPAEETSRGEHDLAPPHDCSRRCVDGRCDSDVQRNTIDTVPASSPLVGRRVAFDEVRGNPAGAGRPEWCIG